VRPGICGVIDGARERHGIEFRGCVRVPDSSHLLDLAVTVYDSTGLKRSLSSQRVSRAAQSVRARLLWGHCAMLTLWTRDTPSGLAAFHRIP
jgi:hypothetical protein